MAQVSFHILLKAGVDEFPLSVHLVSDELEQLSSEVRFRLQTWSRKLFFAFRPLRLLGFAATSTL